MSHLDLLQFHAFCLNETGSRLTEYSRAIAAAVREGDTVLDLGAGSGILALLACRAGARRVYAIESSNAVRLGELIASHTEFADRIEFIQSDSSKVVLNERVDVLVADIHDSFGLQPGGLASFFDARDRLLRPGGIVLPRSIELLIAPVEAEKFYMQEIDIWAKLVHGIDVSPARSFAANQVHAGRFEPGELLSPLEPTGHIDLVRSSNLRFGGTATTSISRHGIVHGLCGCFVTALADDVVMKNVPGDSTTTNFAQAFFPIERPVPVVAGDSVSIAIDSHDGHAIRWQVEVSRAGETLARFDHSTLNGLLMSPRSLRKDARHATFSAMGPDVPERLRVHKSVLSRELGGETVLLNLESGVYYGLDAVGTRAWNLLAEDRTLADVRAVMLDEFDVSAETLERDLAALVRDLCDKQLLVPAEPAS
jgi:protein arginine N-methyltransferase 1